VSVVSSAATMWLGDETDHALVRDLRFSAIELGDSPVLGQDLRLDLGPGTTVLVGRNGAGKSAILERIDTALYNAWSPADSQQPDPGRLACEVKFSHHDVRYACTWRTPTTAETSPALADRLPVTFSVEEVCQIIGSKEVLWRLVDGQLTRNDGTHAEIPRERTLLSWLLANHGDFAFNTMAMPLFNLFFSVQSTPPGTPQRNRGREALIVPYHGPNRGRSRRKEPTARLELLLRRLKDWHERGSEHFAEFLALGRRTELLRDVQVKIYRDPDQATKTPKDLVSVSVDGVDLGLLSDGTVRALELLCALVEPQIKLVLIEEPESAVHPGLLAKLLHEIEAYSSDRQIIMSTHSPQVVSWTRPEALRLVERHDGVTSIRGLADRTIQQLERYLHDEDTLGAFIYGGGLDELQD